MIWGGEKSPPFFCIINNHMIKLVTRWTKRREISEIRLKVCGECEHYILNEYRCDICGCNMKIKTEIPFSSCPLNKWKSYEEEIENG